jgi:hypothetical protein
LLLGISPAAPRSEADGILTMAIVVDEPTISDPFAEPMRHYPASDG